MENENTFELFNNTIKLLEEERKINIEKLKEEYKKENQSIYNNIDILRVEKENMKSLINNEINNINLKIEDNKNKIKENENKIEQLENSNDNKVDIDDLKQQIINKIFPSYSIYISPFKNPPIITEGQWSLIGYISYDLKKDNIFLKNGEIEIININENVGNGYENIYPNTKGYLAVWARTTI